MKAKNKNYFRIWQLIFFALFVLLGYVGFYIYDHHTGITLVWGLVFVNAIPLFAIYELQRHIVEINRYEDIIDQLNDDISEHYKLVNSDPDMNMEDEQVRAQRYMNRLLNTEIYHFLYSFFLGRFEKLSTLKTRRLILRPLVLNDAPWIQEKFNDWDVVQYLSASVPWPYPDNGAEVFLKTVALPQNETGQAINWAITLKESGEGIGIISFRHERDLSDGNRGFWIGKAYQRQGYITEAITAVNNYVFDVLGYDRFEVENAAGNIASRKAKEKTGARLIGTTKRTYVIGEMDTEIWEVTKEEWMKCRDKL